MISEGIGQLLENSNVSVTGIMVQKGGMERVRVRYNSLFCALKNFVVESTLYEKMMSLIF
jgi:hypothetical protein